MKRVLVCSFALIVAGFFFISHIAASQAWLATGNLPQPRYNHQAFLLSDGRVLVGGQGDGVSLPATFYDLVSGAWSNGAVPSRNHQNASAVKLADGRIMFAGGRDTGGSSISNVEIFNPITNTWQVAGQLNRARVLATLTLLPSGKVLAAGGYTNELGFDPTAEVWDPSTNLWTMTGSMSIGKWQHTATLLNDGRVLVAGGEHYQAAGGDDLNVVEIYDPATGTWSLAAPMGRRRASHVAAKLANGRVIVIGGVTTAPAFYDATPTTEIYDPAGNSWSSAASMPSGRANVPPMIMMPDGDLVIVGGQTALNPAAVYTNEVLRYHPPTNSWSVLPPMNTVRVAHTATLLPNGDILAAGGSNGSNTLASAERLTNVGPVTSATLSSQPNGNGWNNSNVTVTLTATVSSGSVQSITYSLSGAQTGGAIVPGSQTAATISAEGATTITFHATDNLGVVEADQSITINIDKTSPALNLPNNIIAPATVSGGAFVNFVADGTDVLSGVVSTIIAPRQSGQLFALGLTHETVTVTDAAGNTSIGGFDVTIVPGRPFTSINGGTFTFDGNAHAATASVTQGNGDPVAGNVSIGYTPGGVNAPVTPGQYAAALSFTSTDPAFTNVFTWNGVANDPVARHAASAGVINGKMYVVGGHPFGDPGLAFPALLGNYAYDPVANTWTQRAAPPVARNFGAGDVINDKLYIAGGCIESNCNLTTNALAAYDPVGNTWATLTAAPLARNLMAGGGINGNLYLAGGAAPFAPTNGLQVYETATGTWSLKANMLQPSHSSAAAVFGGKLYVIGGYDATGPTRRVQVYDPSSNAWSMRAPALSIQIMPATAVINNRIYVFGGSDGTGQSVKTVQSYDPVSDTWSLEPSLPTQRYALVAGVINGRVYVSGGSHLPSQVTGITEVFDPSLTTHITILNETIPPTSSHSVAPPNVNGWYNANVPVTINASDNSSGVNSISYSLSGAQLGDFTVNGGVAAFSITNEGHTTVTYHATDNLGNVENDHSFVVKIDKTAPAASLALGSPANANGWHKFSPGVQISAFDTAIGSQVQSITYTLAGAQNGVFTPFGNFTSFNIFNEGVTTITYHATDQAGNSSPDQFFTIRYDQQPPLIDPISNITVSATSALGAAVNYAAPVVSDSNSGIDTVTSLPASGSTFPHGSTQVTVTATDKGGNVSTRVFTVTVNKSLTSINVQPNSVTLTRGQHQTFQAQGVFTDGSTQMLQSGNGGGGGGGFFGAGDPSWQVLFPQFANFAMCSTAQYPLVGGNALWSSQNLLTHNGQVDETWSPGTPVVHVTGTVTLSDVTLAVECTNHAASGAINATWTGTRYEGTLHFNNTDTPVVMTGWSRKTNMPSARFGLTSAAANGHVYAIGGVGGSCNGSGQCAFAPLANVDVYNPLSESWSAGPSLNAGREGGRAVVLGNLLYVIGGHVPGGQASGIVETLDLNGANQWTVMASDPMPTSRANFALVTDGTYLYAIGGDNNGGQLSTIERFDPTAPAGQRWTTLMPMPVAGNFIGAGVIGGNIIVAGAGGSSRTDIYNIAGNSWSAGPPMPAQRAGMASAVANGGLWLTGGTTNGSLNFDTWGFYPETNQRQAFWWSLGSMPTGRSAASAAVIGDVIYTVGGADASNAALSANEALSTPPDNTGSAGGSSGNGNDTVQWQSLNGSVASIDNGGNATALSIGQSVIVASIGNISCQTTQTCATLTVANTVPAVQIFGGPFTPQESSTFTNLNSGGNFSDPDMQNWTATVDYGDGGGAQPLALSNVNNGFGNFNLSHTYTDNGSFTLTVSVDDHAGGVGVATMQVNVSNKAPQVFGPSGPNPVRINTNSAQNIGCISFFDVPGDAPWTATVNYGDGSGDQEVVVNVGGNCGGGGGGNPPNGAFNLSHIYANAGTFTVTAMVTDKDHGTGSYAFQLTVNAPPLVTIDNTPLAHVNEGSSFNGSASFSDASTDGPWQVTISYGDNSGQSQSTVFNTGSIPLSHVYRDNGSYTITVQVRDNFFAQSSIASATLQVDNVAPTVADLPVLNAIDEGQQVNFTVNFSDPGVNDTQTPFSKASINWGDGSTQEMNVFANNGNGSFSINHQYRDNPAGGGAFTISVTVTDKDGGASTAKTTQLVVNNQPPDPQLNGFGSVDEGAAATFNGQLFDAGALDAPWTGTVDFGDGTSQPLALVLNPAGSTPRATFSVTHTYQQYGHKTLTLKATDKDGATGTRTFSIDVNPIIVSVSISPAQATITTIGDTLLFNATALFSDGSTHQTNGNVIPEVTWSSSNENVATIAANGLATATGAGVATIGIVVQDDLGHTFTAHSTLTVDIGAPVLTLPSNIVTYATSPIGATVSFTATALDAVDGPTTVTCTPGSGSLFVIGVTTVQCSSSDAQGHSATGSFTVTVLSATQIVGELIVDIENFPQANGILSNVLKSLNNSNTGAACNQLGAFINQVQAQAGKKLTQQEATQLIQIANAAKAAIGCP